MNKNSSDEEDFGLTPREKEVLPLLYKCYSNREIANELNITVHTAKAHVSAIIRKFNVKKRQEAVLIAVNLKMVETGRIN